MQTQVVEQEAADTILMPEKTPMLEKKRPEKKRETDPEPKPRQDSGGAKDGTSLSPEARRIAEAAGTLIHEKGYHRVSLEEVAAVVATEASVVTSYFSSKEELCQRVMELHRESLTGLFDQTLEHSNPRQRLGQYLDCLAQEAETLVRYGCPITRLYVELQQESSSLAQPAAALFRLRLDWITEQFRMMGKVDEANDFAIRLTGALYGVTLLASAAGDQAVLKAQLLQLKSWIRSM